MWAEADFIGHCAKMCRTSQSGRWGSGTLQHPLGLNNSTAFIKDAYEAENRFLEKVTDSGSTYIVQSLQH